MSFSWPRALFRVHALFGIGRAGDVVGLVSIWLSFIVRSWFVRGETSKRTSAISRSAISKAFVGRYPRRMFLAVRKSATPRRRPMIVPDLPERPD